MGRRRSIPRPLQLEELVPVLLKEHEEQKSSVTRLSDALATGDYSEAARMVGWLHESLSQHIVDEETQMLKVLLDAYGREGAQQAIKIFKQHRAIHKPIEELILASPEILALKREGLNDLVKIFHEHAEAEEKRVFPFVVKTDRESSEKH